MTMISYAQNREDVLLHRLFPGATGFFVDVGAAHPVDHSVTKYFSRLGWTGINIEPQRGFYEMIVADRPDDINLHTLVSDSVGEAVFYEFPSQQGCGSMEASVAEAVRGEGREVIERRLTVATLDAILAEHAAGRGIDFLKIDVEGHEAAVLRGIDLRVWRPRAIVVEATLPGSPIPNHAEWDGLITSRGYAFACFDGLNRYYLRDEDAALLPKLALPVNVFDDYALNECVAARHDAERFSSAHAALAAILELTRSHLDLLRLQLLDRQPAEAARSAEASS